MPKNNEKNKKYTREFKQSVLKRLEAPTDDTIASLSKELDIPRTTIYQWVNSNNKHSSIHKPINKWTSEDKFQAVLETSTLSERELAEYCRRKGIYVDDIRSWREQCVKANSSSLGDPKELTDNLKQEKDRVKELEKELRRKEKALAEAAALLVLRKKANAIWGDPEED